MSASSTRKRQAAKVVRRLKRDYADAWCALEHETPFQLLIATILSAQCTDERVNLVTRQLFQKYPDVESLAKVPLRTLERQVQSTGFFRNKAKNIKAAAAGIMQDFDGEVPRTIEELIQLPGAARKTANVVLGNAFGINEGMVVDTHIGRLSVRFGFTEHDSKNAVKIEQDLMALFPRRTWTQLAHLFIAHGRAVCKAQRPSVETEKRSRSAISSETAFAASSEVGLYIMFCG
ncbi:MAG: endonuclease III, partial [Planctomycetota bacterium]